MEKKKMLYSSKKKVRQEQKKAAEGKKKAHLVSQTQVSFIQLHTPSYTLSNTKTLLIQFTRKLQTHPTQTWVTCGVDPQTRCQFCDDIIEVPSFQYARWGLGTG